MPSEALWIIRQEHRALSAMLPSLSALVRESHGGQNAPPCGLLRAMLFCIDEFAQRPHHPKESSLLFPKMRRRCPDLAPVLDPLEFDLARGEASVRELQHRLLAWDLLGDARHADFERAALRAVERCLQHRPLEDSTILPAARRDFDALDWADLDAAFAANRDLLAGHGEPDGEYAPLFKRIEQTAPASIGPG